MTVFTTIFQSLMRRLYILILLSTLIAACAPSGQDTTPPIPDQVSFYINKLPDRSFVDSYGDEEQPKVWYTAAEQLGALGADAIPALAQRLHTDDDYELMLVVYALMLASQDPQVMQATQNHYLQLDTVLTPETNSLNKSRALQWCQKYFDICSGQFLLKSSPPQN